MRGVRSLSSGLFIGFIIAATVFGALVLSVRGGQPVAISELPIPTATIQDIFVSPTPTRGVTQPATTAVAAAPSLTPTATPTICPIPPNWQRYSVGPFDTLISIAQQYNLTPEQLVQTNCLSTPGAAMGQTIFVPSLKDQPDHVRGVASAGLKLSNCSDELPPSPQRFARYTRGAGLKAMRAFRNSDLCPALDRR